MASVTIPLVGMPDRRGFQSTVGTKDQKFSGVLFRAVRNHLTGNSTVYVEKRPGWETQSTPASGRKGFAIFVSPSTDSKITAFFTANVVTIYKDLTNVGSMDTGDDVYGIIETVISGTTYYLIASSVNGYYLAGNADVQTAYTGDTHSNTTIDNIASTTGMYAGQAISGSGIPAGTRIASVDSGTAITITQAAVSTASGVALTKTPLAKIIDADFPSGTITGNFVEMDGYVSILTTDGKVYSSDLNSVSAWSASSFIRANMSTDTGVGLAKVTNQIVAFGTDSFEVFYNAGNPSGSPLGRTENALKLVGCVSVGPNAGDGGSMVSPIAQIGDFIFWQAAIGGEGANIRNNAIYVLDGLSPKKISTPVIDRLTPFDYLDAFYFRGYTYLHCVNQDASESWLYNVELDLWFESGFTTCYRIARSNDTYAVDANGTSGKIFVLDPNTGSTWTDGGVSYTMTIQTSKWFGPSGTEGRRITVSRVDLLCDVQSSGSATLETSDDDYANFVNRGTFDLTKNNPKIHRCGSFVGGRAWRITHNANTAFRAWGLRIEYEVSEH